MTTTSINDSPSDSDGDEFDVEAIDGEVLSAEEISFLKQAARGPHGGLYDIPGVGRPLRFARRFFDDMAPQPGDRVAVKIGKNIVRYATVVAVTGAAVTVVF